MLKFPKGFLWGAATSSHQVEGGNFNDWTEWEIENAKIKAQDAALRQSQGVKWPEYILDRYPNPLQKENYISGRACDHYNRFREDFDIAKSLGHNAHRFSIEWSRIEPEEGKFNEKEIEHYREVIKALRERGIEPMVTLWHWTSPVWIGDIGGWENKKTINYFLRYVEKIIGTLQGARFWIVINEPNIYTTYSYVKGKQPPGKRNIFKALKVFNNLLIAHNKAYKIIHKHNKDAQVGLANSVIYFEQKNNIFLNIFLKNIWGYLWNFYTWDKTKNHNDFLGLNYYSRNLIGLGRNKKGKTDVSDLGWDISPKGVYDLILRCHKKYKLPVFITENGIADAEDKKREKFIKDHLFWIYKAIQEGADVRGYFHWSLLDNFEFVELRGFWCRFGLVEIDYRTMERKIRPSALKYAEICKNNAIANLNS